MNSFYTISRFFVPLLSVLYCTSFCSDWSNYPHIKAPVFTYETIKRNFTNTKVHSDFSYDNKWNNVNDHGLSGNTGDFNSYTKEDFQYLCQGGYSESELLNQRCLYMSNEFIEYAQTCADYKDVIQKLYAELKNLSRIQKAYRFAKGTYCKGLQAQIAYLYNQLPPVKTFSENDDCYKVSTSNQYSDSKKVAHFDHAVLGEQFAEYKALEPMYDAYVPSLAKAINERSDIYRNITDRDFVLQGVSKSYNLKSNVKQLLSHYGHELVPFTHSFGNQLQQVIHQESLNIIDRIDSLPASSILYDHQEALVDFAAAMVDYNHANLTEKAMTIGDLCWTLLDYGQAMAEGAALGVYSAAHDILTNPIEATVSIVAGKQVLAFQLCKVLYNVADIGVTAIIDYDRAQEKWNKYAEPLNNIINAIEQKEITIRDALKGGTALVVGYRAQGKLLGGLGKFCRAIQQKGINFIKNNALFNPQEYLTTPEGLLFKATAKSNKSKLEKQGSAASDLKKTVQNKIAKQDNASSISVAGQGVIRQGNLRAKIKEYEEHIFSEKHEQAGLMAAGESREAIMDSLSTTLFSLDKKGFIREGNNQLRIMLNGIDNIEVRCFIQKGEVIGINVFISDFGRIFHNFIDTRKI